MSFYDDTENPEEPQNDDGSNLPTGENGSSEERSSSSSSLTDKKSTEKMAKTLRKSSNLPKQSLLKVLWPILTYVLIFIILLIIIIGIVMFFITMPGMVMDKLKGIAKAVGNAFSAFFGGDETSQVGDEEIYDVMNYLEEMGYDLKDYGFLTDYLDESNFKEDVSGDKKDEAVLDAEIGVARDAEGNIVNAESDFIFTYLVSDNYVYTIANYNQTREDALESEYTGLFGVLKRIAVGADAVWRKIGNIIIGDGYKWGRGLIHIYYEGGNTVGKAGDYLGSGVTDGVFKWVGAKINADEEPPTLEIRRGWGANTIKYSLDGWTGRYGMPLEFLISIHLATMMPDLAYDMVKNFDTKIEMLFRDVEGDVQGAFKVGDRYVSFDDMDAIIESDQMLENIAEGEVSKAEAKEIMDKFNIESPDNCEFFEEVASAPIDESSEFDYDDSECAVMGDFMINDLESSVYYFNEMIDTLTEKGYNGTTLKKITNQTFDQLMDDVTEEKVKNENNVEYYEYKRGYEYYAIREYDINKAKTITEKWETEDGIYTVQIKLMHRKFEGTMQSVDDVTSEEELQECIDRDNFKNQEYSRVSYKITKELTQEQLEEAGVTAVEDYKCSNNKNSDTCCSVCRDYIKRIFKYIKKADVSNFKTFQPYIKDVKNHWYRDVYFVAGDEDFVKYDYDYESKVRERWTLYETYTEGDKAGEYKLYVANTDELYEGTIEEAEENGIILEKRAKTLAPSDSEELLDLNWHKNDGIWSAYEVSEGATITEYEPVYEFEPNDEGDVEVEGDDVIKQNIVAKLTTTNNIVQTGEGQRSATNSTIKKMFLENTYFRYDGSPDTAEAITRIRKGKDLENDNDDIGYGPINNRTILNRYVNEKGERIEKLEDDEGLYYIDSDGNKNRNVKQIKDFTGKVSFEQDALNEFSMLENTHTLDADYIYRDFKELVVELGYFEKEELTDETPRLLQWLVPDTGSYGFPKRGLDKKENESRSTLVHSKGDVDAYLERQIKASGKNNSDNGESDPTPDDDDRTQEGNREGTQENHRDGTLAIPEEETNPPTSRSKPNIETDNSLLKNVVGASAQPTGSGGQFKKDTLIDTATACWQYIVDSGKYSYAGASIPITGGTTVDCSSYVSWILYEYGYEEFAGGQHCTQDFYNTNWQETMGWEEIDVGPGADCSSQVQPGDLFVRDDGNNHGHIQFILSVEPDGTILTYDCGASDHWVKANRDGYASNFTKGDGDNRPGKIIRLEDTARPTGDEYKGYKGNEAVVSPVTGILLEYGTYDGTQKDINTGEEERVNVDIKYGVQKVQYGGEEVDEDGNNEEVPVSINVETSTDTGRVVSEKVGYAKILVLDEKFYQDLEQKLLPETTKNWKDDLGEQWRETFLATNGKFLDLDDINSGFYSGGEIEDKIKEWYKECSTADKTLYGYKEFAELYDEFGIAGNVITIDGFKCEMPDEEFDEKEEGSKPNGKKIEISEFKKITVNSFDSDGELTTQDDNLITSLYEKDEKIKMASKKATVKANMEIDMKDDSIASLYIEGGATQGDFIVLKEGTVIGRTLTDREVVEDYLNEDYEKYRKDPSKDYGEDEDDKDKVIGNYLRVAMVNGEDSTSIENVEDYMKLDDGEQKNQQYDNFSVVGTVIPIDEWVELAYAYTTTHSCSAKFQDKDNLREWYELNVEKGVNPEYTFARGIQESGLSDSSADAAGTNYWGYNTPNGSSSVASYSSWQECLGKYCDTIVEYQDPSTWQYQEIMKRCQEREACTENGGIDPLGYGDPSTVGGQQCLYSWLGDDHSANSAGDGGMYYLYPWGWGGNQYEGENKIIFESKSEFESLCGSKHGTSGGATSSAKTTVWEQGMYTAWQSRKIVTIAKDIFGERAGTYVS